jgi:hypothetical protein
MLESTTSTIYFIYVFFKTILRILFMPFSSIQKHAWISSPFLVGLVTLRGVFKSVPSIRLHIRPQACTLNNCNVAERIGNFRRLLSKQYNFVLKSDKNNVHCTEKSEFFSACEKSISNRGCRDRGERYEYVCHGTLLAPSVHSCLLIFDKF